MRSPDVSVSLPKRTKHFFSVHRRLPSCLPHGLSLGETKSRHTYLHCPLCRYLLPCDTWHLVNLDCHLLALALSHGSPVPQIPRHQDGGPWQILTSLGHVSSGYWSAAVRDSPKAKSRRCILSRLLKRDGRLVAQSERSTRQCRGFAGASFGSDARRQPTPYLHDCGDTPCLMPSPCLLVKEVLVYGGPKTGQVVNQCKRGLFSKLR